MKPFIYIPSFDSGAAQSVARKDMRLDSGLPWRFWDDEFPEFYRHKYYLISAGHNYKKLDHSKKYGFPDDMTIFGDSGGYQLASGVLPWSVDLRPKILDWLETNSTIAVNLDIPPRKLFQNKFEESLNLSYENFKYFYENQSGKVDFLNVLHGSDYSRYKFWYNTVKDFEFQGWACGGSIGKLTAMMDWLIVLLEGKEFFKPNIKFVHMLGASSVLDFLVLAQIQKSLFELGSQVTITTDSSTPSRATTFGFYYLAADFRNLCFRYVTVPRFKDDMVLKINHLPILNEIDRKIFNQYTLSDFLKFKSEHYGWMVTHNYCLFYDIYKQSIDFIWSDYGLLEQILSRDMLMLLYSIDKIIKSDNPRSEYLTKIQVFNKMTRMVSDTTMSVDSDFF